VKGLLLLAEGISEALEILRLHTNDSSKRAIYSRYEKGRAREKCVLPTNFPIALSISLPQITRRSGIKLIPGLHRPKHFRLIVLRFTLRTALRRYIWIS
jgi:hypothetical protein